MMMGNKGTFSAGSMAQGPRGPRRPMARQTSSSTSLGYPTIEGLLETEDFSKLEEGFEDIQSQVAGIISEKTASARTKRRAKLALGAFETALDLIKELLEIKEQIRRG